MRLWGVFRQRVRVHEGIINSINRDDTGDFRLTITLCLHLHLIISLLVVVIHINAIIINTRFRTCWKLGLRLPGCGLEHFRQTRIGDPNIKVILIIDTSKTSIMTSAIITINTERRFLHQSGCQSRICLDFMTTTALVPVVIFWRAVGASEVRGPLPCR